jgi:hypothetical protein
MLWRQVERRQLRSSAGGQLLLSALLLRGLLLQSRLLGLLVLLGRRRGLEQDARSGGGGCQ